MDTSFFLLEGEVETQLKAAEEQEASQEDLKKILREALQERVKQKKILREAQLAR